MFKCRGISFFFFFFEKNSPARLCAVAAPGAYFVIFQAKWRERERIVLEEEGRVFSLRLFEIFEINRS